MAAGAACCCDRPQEPALRVWLPPIHSQHLPLCDSSHQARYQCAESQSQQQQGHSELVPSSVTLGIYFANQACFSS